MRRTLFLGALAVCVLLAACPGSTGGETPIASLDLDGPIAVGGYVQAHATLACLTPGSTTPTTCRRHLLQSATALVGDPPIVEMKVAAVDSARAQFDVKALAPGRTTVRVVLTDTAGGTYPVGKIVQALEVTEVQLRPSCTDPAAVAPYLFPVSSQIDLLYQLWSGDVALAGDGVLSVDAGAFTFKGAGALQARFATPDTRQVGTITSPLDPSLHLDLETYGPGDIDAVTVQVPPEVGYGPFPVWGTIVSQGIPVEVASSVGGRAVCGHLGGRADGVVESPWPSGVNYTMTSSGPCGLQRDGATTVVSQGAPQQVYGYFEGPCLVTAEVAGGTGRGTGVVWFKSPLPRVEDSWHFDNPTPLGNDACSLGGSDGALWVGDGLGALHRWDGVQWHSFRGGRRQAIRAIWSAGIAGAWAGGDVGTLIHWDGSSWQWIDTGLAETITGIWGRSSVDVWAVGSGGTILHFDGVSWSRVPVSVPGERFTSIWGNGTALWIGSRTGVFRWRGSALVKEVSGGSSEGYFLAGTDSGDAWATGDTTYHWSGSGWQPVDTGGVALRRVAAGAGDKVWAVGDAGVYRWDGQRWSLAWAQTGLVGIWANASEAWAAGSAGVMGHWTGAGWEDATRGVRVEGLQLTGLWGSSELDLWAVGRLPSTGSGMILHRLGPGWSVATSTAMGLNALWGAGVNDVWTAGDSGAVLHLDPATGTWTAVTSGTASAIRAIWGSGQSDVWFVGDRSALLHWDGRSLSSSLLGECPTGCGHANHAAISGSSPGDVWVGGSVDWPSPTLWHYDGSTWTAQDPLHSPITGIWGTGPFDVWILGPGTTVHRTEMGWIFYQEIGYTPGPVLGFSSSDVWAGNLHYDGRQWSIFDTPTPIGPLWGTDSQHLWTTGQSGSVLRRGP